MELTRRLFIGGGACACALGPGVLSAAPTAACDPARSVECRARAGLPKGQRWIAGQFLVVGSFASGK